MVEQDEWKRSRICVCGVSGTRCFGSGIAKHISKGSPNLKLSNDIE